MRFVKNVFIILIRAENRESSIVLWEKNYGEKNMGDKNATSTSRWWALLALLFILGDLLIMRNLTMHLIPYFTLFLEYVLVDIVGLVVLFALIRFVLNLFLHHVSKPKIQETGGDKEG
jgi:hypothetical protein